MECQERAAWAASVCPRPGKMCGGGALGRGAGISVLRVRSGKGVAQAGGGGAAPAPLPVSYTHPDAADDMQCVDLG
eukprot:10150909-Alexandrium_andersonii.AAC.1